MRVINIQYERIILILMSASAFINGFLGGLILGLLFAPASGEKTRTKLNDMFSDWRNSLQGTNKEKEEDLPEEFLEEAPQTFTVD
jgi:gas vesicle protein